MVQALLIVDTRKGQRNTQNFPDESSPIIITGHGPDPVAERGLIADIISGGPSVRLAQS